VDEPSPFKRMKRDRYPTGALETLTWHCVLSHVALLGSEALMDEHDSLTVGNMDRYHTGPF